MHTKELGNNGKDDIDYFKPPENDGISEKQNII
jgi:hypothetical protein